MIRAFIGIVGYMIKIIWPHLRRILRVTFGYTIRTFAVMFIGMPRACDLIARDMVRLAVDAGYPSLFEQRLYVVCYVIAIVQFLIGWVILSFITVWIFWRVF